MYRSGTALLNVTYNSGWLREGMRVLYVVVWASLPKNLNPRHYRHRLLERWMMLVLLFSIDCSTFSGCSTLGGLHLERFGGILLDLEVMAFYRVFWMCGSAIVVGLSLAHFILLRGYQMLLLCRYCLFFCCHHHCHCCHRCRNQTHLSSSLDT